MTPNDFAIWLKGVIDTIKDSGNTHVNVSFIEEKLKSVKQEQVSVIPQFPVPRTPVPDPLMPPYKITSGGIDG